MARSWKPKTGSQVTTPIAVLILLLILFVSTGYFYFETVPGLPPDNRDVLQRVADAEQLWSEQRPSRFRYVVDRDCDCDRETRQSYVATEANGVRSAEYPIPVESADGQQLIAPREPVYIDELFESVRSADAESRAVTARFDAAYGFPINVVIHAESGIDERYDIRDFERLHFE